MFAELADRQSDREGPFVPEYVGHEPAFGAIAFPSGERYANEINRFATLRRAKWRIDTHSLFRLLANFSGSIA
jgi:hypothetical protein